MAKKSISETLRQRVQESYEKRGSGKFSNYFTDMPDGIEWWRCTADSHLIDIIPWGAGSKYPTRNYPNVREGDPVYVLDVWIHRRIGPNEDNFVCPARNYNDPCAICDYIRTLRESEEATDDQITEISPKRRAAYLILCHDSEKEYDKGVQLFEVAHWFMERHLTELAVIPGRHGQKAGMIAFPAPEKEEGKSISFKREGTDTSTQFIAHKFVDRDYDIPQEILDQAFSLDEYLYVPTYQELEDALYGGSSTVGTESEEEVEEPPKGRPERKSARDVEENPCPIGLRFGVDTDEYTECDDCPKEIWTACAAEGQKLKRDKEDKPSRPTPKPKPKAGLQRRG